jgi:hypothetical protein
LITTAISHKLKNGVGGDRNYADEKCDLYTIYNIVKVLHHWAKYRWTNWRKEEMHA